MLPMILAVVAVLVILLLYLKIVWLKVRIDGLQWRLEQTAYSSQVEILKQTMELRYEHLESDLRRLEDLLRKRSDRQKIELYVSRKPAMSPAVPIRNDADKAVVQESSRHPTNAALDPRAAGIETGHGSLMIDGTQVGRR